LRAEEKGKSLLFLKKKKQKDFHPFARRSIGASATQTNESFLVLFFKKERAFFSR